ncbi:MAG: TniB family NTP-binding protein [Flavobacteriaceae bacterium]|nr:TniB family NTP-binding protein [Flavobacteriaceae bacterium]
MNTIVSLADIPSRNISPQAITEDINAEEQISIKTRGEAIKASPLDRKNYVAKIKVKTPDFVNAIDLLESHFQKSGQKDPGGVVIYADSGMGKSFIASHFLESHPITIEDGQHIVPVLYVKAVSSTPRRELIKQMLTMLGYPFTKSNDIPTLMHDLINAIIIRKVKHIIFDEAQEFGEGRGQVLPAAIGNTFKNIHDKADVTMSFLGVEKNLARFFKLAEQLKERITAEHYIKPFDNDVNFEGFICAFDEALPMPELSRLGEKYSEQIHMATSGRLRRTKRLLAHGVYFASLDDSPTVMKKHLKKAYFDVFGSTINPFL